MPVRRKTKKAKQKAEMRARFTLDERPEEDLKYWLIHIVHWHAFLVAVIAVLSIGHAYFNVATR